VNQFNVQRSSRVSCVVGAAILCLIAVPAKAAKLVDLRIGLHDSYTRVVLETDVKASCQIESSGREELVVRLNASSGSRVVASQRSTHLASVAVKPAGADATEIRIALRGPVAVKKLILSAPPRVVLDLREAQEAEAPTPTAEQPAPPAPEPESVSDVPSEAAPAEPVTPVAEETEAVDRGEAGAVPAMSEPDPSAVLAAREAVKKPVPAAPKPANLPRRVVVPPPPVVESGLLDRLPAPFNRPLVLAGIAAALIFVIAIVALRRRGAAADDEPITPFAAGEPFSVDEQPGVAEEPEGAEESEAVEQPDVAEADRDLPARPGEAGEETSLFDQPVETVEALDEQQSEEPVVEDRDEFPVVSPAVEPTPSPELVQRLAQLEERLEEMIDEKDRLGRQVAAQTEELRVQRAAIARTQRVLRDLARPGDEATEPVPKP
jgi:hypothetical protein